MMKLLHAMRERGGRAAALAWAGLLSGAAAAQPVGYQIEPTHTFVHWDVVHFGTATIRGRFGGAEGSVTLDRAAGRGEVSVSLDLATLSTGVAPFDAKLRSSEFFDVAQNPKAWFVGRKLVFDGAGLKSVSGELTLRGVSQGLTLTATRFSCREHPLLKREVCGGDFEATLRRSDFGLSFGVPLIADRVVLRLQIEALRL